MSTQQPEILFLCVHNAGRSQMAAAFARELGNDRIKVYSAGSAPGEHLNPAVVEVMREKGIDITGEKPQKLTDEMALSADVVITMGCGDACPVYPGKRYVDWEITDPAGKQLEEVRPIRDDVERHVAALIDKLLTANN
jgi:protein-tyrosine-phosphatase